MIVMLPLFSITALNTVLLGVAWKHRAKSGRKEEGNNMTHARTHARTHTHTHTNKHTRTRTRVRIKLT